MRSVETVELGKEKVEGTGTGEQPSAEVYGPLHSSCECDNPPAADAKRGGFLHADITETTTPSPTVRSYHTIIYS
jgi:hypothetical protein